MSRLSSNLFAMVIARSPRLLDAPIRGASTEQVAWYLEWTNRMFATFDQVGY